MQNVQRETQKIREKTDFCETLVYSVFIIRFLILFCFPKRRFFLLKVLFNVDLKYFLIKYLL